MQLQYTYWQENDGWYLGYLNDYPEHWTQGKTICELEEMLADLYELQQEESTTPPQAAGYVVSPEELHSGVHTLFPPQGRGIHIFGTNHRKTSLSAKSEI
ncbi:MAG: hypothetical protein Ta2A_04300 [Treponemataceae bacterium]|nr:MAG: hypothetical protein Ta2A_04300 [Treponemataceae bacterium]